MNDSVAESRNGLGPAARSAVTRGTSGVTGPFASTSSRSLRGVAERTSGTDTPEATSRDQPLAGSDSTTRRPSGRFVNAKVSADSVRPEAALASKSHASVAASGRKTDA